MASANSTLRIVSVVINTASANLHAL